MQLRRKVVDYYKTKQRSEVLIAISYNNSGLRVIQRIAFYFIVRNSLDNERYVIPIKDRITVGYARKNVIGSRTSFVIASVRSSIH